MHLRVPLPLPYTPPLFTAVEMDLPPVQYLRHFVIGKSWQRFFVVEREARPAESGQQGEGAEEECVCSHWDNKRRLPLVALRFIICSPSSARDPAPLTGRHRGQSAASRVDRCASQSPHSSLHLLSSHPTPFSVILPLLPLTLLTLPHPFLRSRSSPPSFMLTWLQASHSGSVLFQKHFIIPMLPTNKQINK